MIKKKIIFWGNSNSSLYFLEELIKKEIWPDLIIVKKNRKNLNPVKNWSEKQNLKILEINDLSNITKEIINNYDLSIIVSFGLILPPRLINLNNHIFLNLHYSLLPKYRGASPLKTSILNDEKKNGISFIKINEKLDTGHLIFQKEIKIIEWQKIDKIEKQFSQIGAQYFIKLLNQDYWTETIQKENSATYAHKLTKIAGEIQEKDSERDKFLKYCALEKPFFIFKNKRFIIQEAIFENNEFKIQKLIPEGKKEISYIDFLNSYQIKK